MENWVTPVTVRGRYFWRGDNRFLINGTAYQLHNIDEEGKRRHLDPLASEQLETLQRSIPLFKELRLNTLFIYYIDETKNHHAAMTLLAEAGIYVLTCLCGTVYDDQRYMSCKAPSMTYSSQLLSSCFGVIDAMSLYPNTLGFMVADQFLDTPRVTTSASYLRALTRDIKRYIAINARHNQRAIPVGVSAIDITYLLKTQFDYFSAGPEEEAIDFFAFNSTWGQWSFASIMGTSPLEIFSSAHIPVFISHYQSNGNALRPEFNPRDVYSNDNMLRVFSGGIVHPYFDRPDRNGLVKRTIANGTVILRKRDEFRSLRSILSRVFPPLDTEKRAPGASLVESGMSDEDYEVISVGDDGWTEDEKMDLSMISDMPQRPKLPPRTVLWEASHDMPTSPLDWAELETQMEEKFRDSEWTDIQKEILDMAIEDLALGFRDKLII